MTLDGARQIAISLLQQIVPDADVESADPDLDLRRVLDMDSLDFQILVERVAEATGIEIPETDYAQVRSLSGLCDYLVRQM